MQFTYGLRLGHDSLYSRQRKTEVQLTWLKAKRLSPAYSAVWLMFKYADMVYSDMSIYARYVYVFTTADQTLKSGPSAEDITKALQSSCDCCRLRGQSGMDWMCEACSTGPSLTTL